MKRLLMLLPFALLTLGATPAQPPAPIVALTQSILDAANANNAGKFVGLYTDDAIVVDEDAPFVWRGAHAGETWWHGVQRALASRKATTLHATGASPANFMTDREGDDAYVEQPLTIVVTSGRVSHVEHGTQTYTFHKSDDGVWRISRQVWTTTGKGRSDSTIPSGADGTTRMMVDAFNKRMPSIMNRLYTDDATMIDAMSPFTWDGTHAGARWYTKAMKYLAANGLSRVQGRIDGAPLEVRTKGDDAYAIVPITMSGMANGKPFAQRGTYTFTLHRVNDAWLITSQTWLTTN